MKEKIGLISDTSSSITKEEAKKMNVEILRIPVIIDEVEYYEEENIDYPKFVAFMKAGKLPKTSQPAIGEAKEMIERMLTTYDKIIIVPIHAGLSSTYSTLKSLVDSEFSDRVFVANSGVVSTNLRYQVKKVKKMIDSGVSFNEIKSYLENNTEPCMVYLAPKEINHLKRTGRVTALAATMANLLKINVILKMGGGEEKFDAYQKVRTFKKAITSMIEFHQKDGKTAQKNFFIILHADNLEDAQFAEAELKRLYGEEVQYEMDLISPIIAAHTGLGTISICALDK